MPSESSATIGEYLQTSTGKRNTVWAIGIFVIGLAIFDAMGFGADILLFIFISLCATAAFANLWREATICFVAGFVFWQFIILPLWIAAINILTFVPALGGVLLNVFAFGFLFAEVFSPEKPQSVESKSLYERIIYPGRRLRFLLLAFLPLTDIDTVPRFFSSQEQQSQAGERVQPTAAEAAMPSYIFNAPILEEPVSGVKLDVESEATVEPAFEPVVQPKAAKTERSVMSAPIAGSGLYVYTFILEFVGAVARSVVTAILATVALFPVYFLIFSINTSSYYRGSIASTFDGGAWLRENTIICMTISLVIGFGFGFWPLLTSLFHVVLPVMRSGSGPTERDTLGAREPTRDEMETIIDTMQRIQAESGKTIKKGAPSQWLVLDEPFPDAYTIGSTVYLTRAAIENDNLAGIMAHEMGHIAHKDGDLLLSLRRFIVPLAYWVGIDRQATAAGAVLGTGSTARLGSMQTEDEKIFFRFQSLKIKLWLAFWFGGVGLLLLGRAWAQFWRYRDFMADEYAVQLGQGDSLMSLLEIYRHIDVAQPYLLTNRPYTAERLDRLKG